MKKLIKIGVTFLLSICCLTPFNVHATDIIYEYEQEECPNGYICTYKLDDNLGVYMLASIEENTSIDILSDSGTGTVVPKMYMELYYESGFTGTTVIYPDQRAFAHDAIKIMNIFWYTEYAKSDYVSIEFSFSLSNTTNAFNNIKSIKVNNQQVNEYSYSGGKLWIKQTVKADRSDSIMNVWIEYNSPMRFNDQITLSCTTKIDENGLMNQGISAMSQALSNILHTLNTDFYNFLQNINANVSSINGLLETSITPLLEQIKTNTLNINTSVNNIGTNIVSSITLLTNNVTNYFDNLYWWITNNTNNVLGKLDNVINAIRGDDKVVESKPNLENSTNDLDDTINEYDGIEHELVDDFNTNIGAIKPNNDLITNNDFIKTSTFVATQMTRIYESNSIIQMTITFGLIIGLAFTIIGISVKR